MMKEEYHVKNQLAKKYLFSFLFISLLLLMGFSASAADSHDGWKCVNQVSDLSNQLTPVENYHVVQPGYYYLNKNISVQNCFVVQSGQVTICLHGYNLETTNKPFAFIVRGGASLNLQTCGSGEGALVNSHTSTSAAAVYVAGNSSLYVNDAYVLSSAGNAISLNTGVVRLTSSTVRGDRNGIDLQAGDVLVYNSEVWGMKNYGIDINQAGGKKVGIHQNGGLITGFAGGIVASSSTATIETTIEDGAVDASNGFLPCIDLKKENGKLTILDGSFVGIFQSPMKGDVRGGQYSDESIKGYVADGYICRPTSDLYYSYKVGPKQTYTVRFTDGNGTELKTQTVLEGDSAAAPAAPTRSGYVFAGWDRYFTNLSGAETVITVNAKWEAAGSGSAGGSPALITKVDLKQIASLRLRASKTSITVRWRKPSSKNLKKISGYEIWYGKKKDFSDAKKITVSKSKTKAVLKKLKRKTLYYVRIRARKTSGNVVHVSKWTAKKIKTR